MTTTSAKTRAPAMVLLALATGGFAIGTTEFATMSLLPFVAEGLGIDEPTAGHIISAYAIGVVVGAPVLAVLSARIRRRALLVALMLFFALGNALSAIAPSYHWMLAFRFLSGLPHGAYFGIAALVAAGVMGPEQRTTAVGRVMLGLTVATIIGVPLANTIGQLMGWRWGFAIVAAIALLTALLVRLYAPDDPVAADASPLRELGALGRRQVWLTLATGAIGFGGLFAVYAYLQSTLTEVTGMAALATPLVFAAFGVGMTLGNLVVPRFADRALVPTATAMLALSAVALALFPLAAQRVPTVMLDVLAIGFSASLATVLQTRLMDVAGDAQALAAALNHSAFNTANAIGPLLGGLAIAAGWGWTSTGYVGCALALLGLVIWGIATWDARRTERKPRIGGVAHAV
ncbi:MFS transporter [Sphingomonas qomolangmaensis]|uniref:MFS transporter n=1 Tax=Sphingomonas qomolangmaensis TaxID=2918765 RepID=A0ABY5LCI9_9SPHN|nr:MFS transporter [Sphingomonas qomolangmaensis]UUL83826.1 MFS transporter [Sphingomonas qomolangmaensis]